MRWAEVTVTARKREERAQDVPDSLVVLDSTKLESMRVTQAGDVGKLFPNIGLKQDLSVTSTFISIRGITATRNTDPAVSSDHRRRADQQCECPAAGAHGRGSH